MLEKKKETRDNKNGLFQKFSNITCLKHFYLFIKNMGKLSEEKCIFKFEFIILFV